MTRHMRHSRSQEMHLSSGMHFPTFGTSFDKLIIYSGPVFPIFQFLSTFSYILPQSANSPPDWFRSSSG